MHALVKALMHMPVVASEYKHLTDIHLWQPLCTCDIHISVRVIGSSPVSVLPLLVFFPYWGLLRISSPYLPIPLIDTPTYIVMLIDAHPRPPY